MSITRLSFNQLNRDNAVSVIDYGADPTGSVDATAAIQTAIDALPSGGTVYIPNGTYIVSALTVTKDNISICGAELGNSKLVSPAGRWGHMITANDVDFFTLQDIEFDCNLATTEGALWIGGGRWCLVERCKFYNCDLTTMSINSIGISGGSRTAIDNTVRDCYAYGQKRFTPGGTATFIAANGATRTTFENCVVEDCEADNFGADNGPYTLFHNCRASKSSTRSTYAAFWLECTEVNGDGYDVTISTCHMSNFAIGIGVSEKVVALLENFTYRACSRAIWAHGDESSRISGGLLDLCGVAASDTDGAVLIENSADISGLTFRNTVGNSCIVVYAATAKTGKIVNINECTVDARINIGYVSGGAESVVVSNCTLNSTSIWYFDCSTKRLLINGNTFIDSIVTGSRIINSTIAGNTFVDTSGTLTAIDLSLDTFNTFFDNNSFYGFLAVTNNATAGRNTYVNCTSTPDTRDYVIKKTVTITTGGTLYSLGGNSRGSYLILVEGTSNDNAVGAYLAQAESFTSGHTITTLAERADLGTGNFFSINYPSGDELKITHPTSGRVANVTIISFGGFT